MIYMSMSTALGWAELKFKVNGHHVFGPSSAHQLKCQLIPDPTHLFPLDILLNQVHVPTTRLVFSLMNLFMRSTHLRIHECFKFSFGIFTLQTRFFGPIKNNF